MYCNQIFSILKKKIEPVIETPVEENSESLSESVSEEMSESESLSESESVSSSESEIVSEEPIEENSESESEDPIEEEITEDPEEIEESPTYVVANVIVCKSYEIASRIARCEFGESALAIDTTLYPVSIGDTYRDGVFYDSLGNVIERNLTESEQIEELTRKNKELNEIVSALFGLEG